jgi:hypothetical protein
MSEKHFFRVGDLVIMQRAEYFEEWNGAVALVVAELRLRRAVDLHTMTTVLAKAHKVRLPDGRIVVAGPYQMRRLFDSGKRLVGELSKERLQELAR